MSSTSQATFTLGGQYKVRATNMRYGATPVRQINLVLTKGKKYSLDEIKKIARDVREDIQKRYPNKYDIAISPRDVHHGWRGGKFSNTRHGGVYVWSPDEYSKEFENQDISQSLQADDFAIYVRPTQEPHADYAGLDRAAFGADGATNDCVWNCLMESPGPSRCPWEKPEDLKEYLGLERNDKISLNLLPQVEKKLDDIRLEIQPHPDQHKYSRSVSYISDKDAPITLSWLSQGDHCVLPTDKTQTYGRTFCEQPKKLKLFHDDKKNKEAISLYLHKTIEGKYRVVEQKWSGSNEYKKFRNILFKSYQMVTDRKWEHFVEVSDLTKNLRDEYKTLILSNRILTKELNIDYFKTGNTTATALAYFYKTIKHLPLKSVATTNEQVWLKNSYKGGIQYADKWEGQGYKYDYVSFYPSLLASDRLYPIKGGEYKIMTEWVEDQPAIYRAIVSKGHLYFRYNETDYYTHADLQTAKMMGLDIHLIQDGQANCLWYGKEKCVRGYTYFAEYVNTLFRIKKIYGKKCPYAKLLLNCLSGILGQQCKKEKLAYEPELDISHMTIDKIYGSDNDKPRLTYTQVNNCFKYAHLCRFAPFLTSYGRTEVCEVLNHFDPPTIKHIHTDGFVLSEDHETDTEGLLGEIVSEGSEYCQISHVNSVKKRLPCGNYAKW